MLLRSKIVCRVEGCGCHHHTLVHVNTGEDLEVFDRNGNGNADNPEVKLRVAQTRFYDSKNEKSVIINGIIDDFATLTILDESVAEFLGLNGPSATLRLK